MRPTIADAKRLATEQRCTGVLILYFQGGEYGYISYGHTRTTCNAMGQIGDDIFEHIGDGLIEVPSVLMGPAVRP